MPALLKTREAWEKVNGNEVDLTMQWLSETEQTEVNHEAKYQTKNAKASKKINKQTMENNKTYAFTASIHT